MTDVLFEMEPTVTPAEPAEKLSVDRRRTLRQRADIARGVHPLTRTRVHDDETRTCGNCRFRELFYHHNRNYPKCSFGAWERATHGAATDVRAWWPACGDHEWADAS